MFRVVRILSLALPLVLSVTSGAAAGLRVGAAIVDITPQQLPVLVNGSMTSRSVDKIKTHVNARAVVLDDGTERIGIVVVDSCLMPRQFLDEAKQLAATRTSIRTDRMLISATHTHTAPSSMAALGTEADAQYVPFLRQKLADALVAAEQNLQPARVGWGSGEAAQFTALRRWVRRPDRVAEDPFGNLTVRANMHSANNLDDVIGPSGPEDPQLALIAFEDLSGKPLAVLANFSMHYFGDKDISADYFGLFCDSMQRYLAREHGADEDKVVAIMSHGCSGDIWRRDYVRRPAISEGTIEAYTQGLLDVAKQAYLDCEYEESADLAMQEARQTMKYRVPDAQRLKWAEEIYEELDGRLPKTRPEIYAREQVYLHQMQETEVVTQAIRIGEIAIATTPTETYALTGLKLKLQSPKPKTMVIELANGGDGYIPPPEQHPLGGYNTWAARSAGLEPSAEARIVATLLDSLEQVCDSSRRPFVQSIGNKTQAILDSSPHAYWRLDSFSAGNLRSSTTTSTSAMFEPGVLFFLPGPPAFTAGEEVNRCSHFAGGRINAYLPDVEKQFSVVLSLWNGMPLNARDVTGWLVSRDRSDVTTRGGIHLGLAGTGENSGKLILRVGDAPPVFGRTAIERWKWEQVALVCDTNTVRVYIAGNSSPEIQFELPKDSSFVAAPAIASMFLGGRSDNDSNWEGKLDEIAIYDRALLASEVMEILAK